MRLRRTARRKENETKKGKGSRKDIKLKTEEPRMNNKHGRKEDVKSSKLTDVGLRRLPVRAGACTGRHDDGAVVKLATNSSKEELEIQKTQITIDRLSQKFLANEKNPPRRKSQRVASQESTSGNEADLDTNTDMGSDCNSYDLYEFDQSDEVRLRLDLSPERGSMKNQSLNRSTKSLKSSGGPKSRKAPLLSESSSTESNKCARKTAMKRKYWETNCHGSSAPKRSKSSSSEKPRKKSELAAHQRKNIKNLPSVLSKSPLRSLSMTSKANIALSAKSIRMSLGDSGVFMTPPSLLQNNQSESNTPVDTLPTSTPSLPRKAASQVTEKATGPTKRPAATIKKPPANTPKPQVVARDRAPPKKAKKFTKAPDLMDSPMLSPVQHAHSLDSAVVTGALITSQSELFSEDFGSPVMKRSAKTPSAQCPSDKVEDGGYQALDNSKTYKNQRLSTSLRINSASGKAKKGKGSKKRFSVGKYEVEADARNREFDDLDQNYELSIEG